MSFYKFCYYFLKPLVSLIYPMKYSGKEHIPEGAAIICGNHSSYIDPILACYAFGKNQFLHFMAKIELFKAPWAKRLLTRLGAFAVDRGHGDIGAIKTAMKYLKSGEKVFIFPEGTRVSSDDAVQAKTGAVRLASKLNVPIVPVYIPRDKHAFKRGEVIIGEPYYIGKADREAFPELAEELMHKINSLRPVA